MSIFKGIGDLFGTASGAAANVLEGASGGIGSALANPDFWVNQWNGAGGGANNVLPGPSLPNLETQRSGISTFGIVAFLAVGLGAIIWGLNPKKKTVRRKKRKTVSAARTFRARSVGKARTSAYKNPGPDARRNALKARGIKGIPDGKRYGDMTTREKRLFNVNKANKSNPKKRK